MKYKDIKDFYERCNKHPDHQTGMISYSMIERRLREEIEELRQYIEQREQSQQKPVAWMHTSIEDNIISHKPADLKKHPERWTALYAAPPQRDGSEHYRDMYLKVRDELAALQQRTWVGLTDEEVGEFTAYVYAGDPQYVRLIENKLKEKNT
jgi:hypothetical protein